MAKSPKRSPTTSSPVRTRLTGSAALIAALQATINDPVLRAILSCLAPIAVEVFLSYYERGARRLLIYLEDRDRLLAERLNAKRQSEKLRLAEQALKDALEDPFLPEEVKAKLKVDFAQGKAVLAKTAMVVAFASYTPSVESAGSAQQIQGGSIG